MIEINGYTLLDVDSSGRFVVETPEGNQERITMKGYADFILWANAQGEEENEGENGFSEDTQGKSIDEILQEFEYNIRQEIKKENAVLLESIEKIIKNANNKK